MGAALVDEQGRDVAHGVVGELVLRRPSIGLTRRLWNDDERYLESYWNALALPVEDLPKTRNMKIMRRVVRAACLGEDAGDVVARQPRGRRGARQQLALAGHSP
jgi:acyl-coenzyme A synthetase/AMP-(fatty) acid ligase